MTVVRKLGASLALAMLAVASWSLAYADGACEWTFVSKNTNSPCNGATATMDSTACVDAGCVVDGCRTSGSVVITVPANCTAVLYFEDPVNGRTRDTLEGPGNATINIANLWSCGNFCYSIKVDISCPISAPCTLWEINCTCSEC